MKKRKKLKKKKKAHHKPDEEEYKRGAVNLVISSGKTSQQVARELGCSACRLHLWKKQHLAEMALREVEGRPTRGRGTGTGKRALRKQV